MRIIAGKFRGRRLEAPEGEAVRPTSDRAREALFNVLIHGRYRAGGGSVVESATVLDAFCGTGALGLEALSRGAKRATLLDSDAKVLAVARRNVRKLGVENQVTFVLADATQPPRARTAHDLVFLDAPYDSDLAEPALAALAAAGWLAPGALVVVERPTRRANFTAPEGFEERERRKYGAATLIFLSYGRAAD
jgi:16S rRNA (guanine966-N2)-methyltransferase